MNMGQYYALLNTIKSLKMSSAITISTNYLAIHLDNRHHKAISAQQIDFFVPQDLSDSDPFIIFQNGRRALGVFSEYPGDDWAPSGTLMEFAEDNKVRDDFEYEWVVAQVPVTMIDDLFTVALQYDMFSWSAWCGRHGYRRDRKLVWVAFLKATHDSILAAKAAEEAAEAAEAEAEAEAEAAEAEYASEAVWYE